jgi:hypothetical protein
MAFVVQPVQEIYFVPDAQLAAYQAAGWVQATAPQIAIWNANDTYGGTQGAPPAPTLPTGGAPPPTTIAN